MVQIQVQTVSGLILDVSDAVVALSETLGNGSQDVAVAIPFLTKETLENVIQWAEHQKLTGSDGDGAAGYSPHQMDDWDEQFLAKLDAKSFFELLQAANNLGLAQLRIACCKKLAALMRGKHPQEIIGSLELRGAETGNGN